MMQMLQQVMGGINEDLQALREACYEAYEHQDSRLNNIDERITNLESNSTRAASADEATLKELIQVEMRAMKPDEQQRSHSVPPNPSKVIYPECQENVTQKAEAECLLQPRVAGIVKRKDASVTVSKCLQRAGCDILQAQSQGAEHETCQGQDSDHQVVQRQVVEGCHSLEAHRPGQQLRAAGSGQL